MSWADWSGFLTRPLSMREHLDNNDRISQAVQVVVEDDDGPFPELRHIDDQISEAVERLLALHKGG